MPETLVCTQTFGWLLGPISSDLCNNILGGFAGGVMTTLLVGVVAWLWNRKRQARLKEFADLLGVIIEHRNEGKQPVPSNPAWVERAITLEAEAVTKGRKVSPATGSLIHSLGDLVHYSIDPQVTGRQALYVGILSTVIDRMQAAIQRHDR